MNESGKTPVHKPINIIKRKERFGLNVPMTWLERKE